MITLTAPPGDTIARSYDRTPERWRRFMARLRRDYQGAHFEYYRVIERQSRGHAHIHALLRGPLVIPSEIRRVAHTAGFGHQAHIRRASRFDASYLTKQLGTESPASRKLAGLPALPRWFHPTSSSRRWAPSFRVRRDEWRRLVDPKSFLWRVVAGAPRGIADQLERLGYAVAYSGP